jgi:hypothetical protein
LLGPPVVERSPEELAEDHARAAPPEAERTVASLAKYLAGPCPTKALKARAVYCWITDRIAYDAAAFFSGRPGDQSPEHVLATREAVCDGYANLFVALCASADVGAVKLTGFAKGVGDGGPHAWNAVLTEGGWRLADPTWGAGSLVERRFRKEPTRSYLFVSPKLLIFTHLPADRRWQLLDRVVTADEFKRLPAIRRPAIELGISGDDLLAAALPPSSRGVVGVFSHPGKDTAVLAAPLTRHLRAGAEYKFQFRSADYASLLVVNGGQPARFEKSGDRFSVSVTARKGRLTVAGILPGDAARYHNILEYTVE